MEKLNLKQIEAINSIEGPVLVIAGAGSGKTTVLIERIKELINNDVDQIYIFAFTFTNQATNEMKLRLTKALKREIKVNISNFHAFTFSYINMYFYNNPYKVVQDSEKEKIIKNLLFENKISTEVYNIVKFISKIKNRMKPDKMLLSIRLDYIKIYFLYQEYLEKTRKIDFDEMNYKFLELIHSDEYFKYLMQELSKYILVDESQDINWVQYEILKVLCENHNNLFMVGDSNQSIYSFRGSDNRIMEVFEKELNAKVINLDTNYRSTNKIINAANNVISNNTNKFNLDLKGVKEDGEDIVIKRCYSKLEEAYFVSEEIKKLVEEGYKYSDFLILYRNNASASVFDIKLNLNNIPHFIYGNRFIDYKEIKYLLNYYELILNQNDNEAFITIVNVPKRKIGDTTITDMKTNSFYTKESYYETAKKLNNKHVDKFIELIEDLKQKIFKLNKLEFFDLLVELLNVDSFSKDFRDKKRRLNNINILRVLFENNLNEYNSLTLRNFLNDLYMSNTKIEDDNVVNLMTIHQAKGLENKIVFLVDIRDDIIPGKKNNIDIEEERRIFYVGVTRAQERLYITSSSCDICGDNKIPSRFIYELQ